MNIKKRIIGLVLAASIIIPTFLVFPVSAYSTSLPKGIQLYTGWRNNDISSPYEAYTNQDILSLSAFTTDFVINSGTSRFSYYNSTTPIVTFAEINAIPLSDTNVGSAANLASLKTQYINYLNATSPSINLVAQANQEVALAVQIIQQVPNATIWFCFPQIYYHPLSLNYQTPFTNYAAYLKSSLDAYSTSYWTNNIRGFYYATEEIGSYSTAFDVGLSNFGNKQVALMSALSTLVRTTYGKQFLWMPYMGTDTGTSVTSSNFMRVGYVANKTSIFNYVLLQPNYYFDANADPIPLRRVQTSAINNKVYNYAGNVIGSTKTGTSTIGVVMEIDSNVTSFDYNARYYEYTLKYGSIKSTVPIIFYAGARNSTMNSSVFYYVSTFLNY